MPVTINQMSTEISVDPAPGSRGGDQAGPASAPAEEVQIEELRAIVRELIAEEMERYRRTAVEY
ncbi:DUF5908 family protein [Sphingobium sp. AP49]|uniref:DUF5908 family protein n=1 Tax=Sphingobium sp. AP49 TaxID=1144307 RepID=UPI00026ECED0|nr:DUF5908 family protein [Sphingobium sp. AP49]WHO39160.1 DUF5908 family protein [Sphingobium sp. AP49]